MGLPRLTSKLFTADGTWRAPAGVTRIWVEGCGSGGSGGGGEGGNTSNSLRSSGGAGGGGAIVSRHLYTTTPGHLYTIQVGESRNGGLGGQTALETGNDGYDGESSIFGVGEAVELEFKGGAKGKGGSTGGFSCMGGHPIAGRQRTFVIGSTYSTGFDQVPGSGGNGGHRNDLAAGAGVASNITDGGSAGAAGSDSGVKFGGCGGGGGGASGYPNSTPGDGGGGGNGNGVGGAGSNGSNGGTSEDGFGSGGGGGGGGGSGASAGLGGQGGASGAGYILIEFVD